MELTTLYRPVGYYELDLIRRLKFKSFPPRLSNQPFLYLSSSQEIAEQIAKDRYTIDNQTEYAGFVLKLVVNTKCSMKFRTDYEYLIPAISLDEFNTNIIGQISIIKTYFGPLFKPMSVQN